ncbi:WD40-repeat-containing domain protein [Suillus spraguei]|nr:WD40-repeat-containing domain protein [Suillus spraguei]
MSFLALFNKSAQPLRYKLLACLTAYNGSIHALAISNDGHLLACSGTKGIKIWDIKSQKELTSSSNHHESRGTVSCAIWAMTTKTAAETLCYGTGLGYIVCLRHSLTDEKFQEICARRLGSGFEITCLSWHSTSSEGNLRIVVGTRDKMVQVLTLNTSSQLQPVFASVAFADNQSIYVFGLYDGNFMKLKDEDGDIVQEISCKSVIGHAVVYSKRGVFIVDNATDSFTLYRLEGDGEPLRTFATGLPSVSVPKQVAFGEEGKVVVGGSDHGLVYIFDWKTGETLETLHHADTGLVQTISARDLNGRCTFASTSPVLGRGKTTIKIWAYDYAVPKDSTLNRVHGYMTSATMINVADDFSQRVQAAMIFDEYVDIQKDKEGPTEGYIKNDIVMLRELAAKILELAQEADGEIDKDDHRGKCDTDYPQAAKGDEEAKDLSPIDLSPIQYM